LGYRFVLRKNNITYGKINLLFTNLQDHKRSTGINAVKQKRKILARCGVVHCKTSSKSIFFLFYSTRHDYSSVDFRFDILQSVRISK
jgi:hypothetical protein